MVNFVYNLQTSDIKNDFAFILAVSNINIRNFISLNHFEIRKQNLRREFEFKIISACIDSVSAKMLKK